MSNSVFSTSTRIAAVGANTGASNVVQINASGTAFTKSALTQITASWPFDSEECWLIVDSPSSGAELFSIDIARGPALSEFTIVSDVWVPMSESSLCLWLPLRINAGERISAKINSSAALTYANVQMFAVSGSPKRTYGLGAGLGHYATNLNSATIRGTQIDPGAAGNTKSATWTTLVSSFGFNVKQLYVTAKGWNSAGTACTGLVDIGVGASTAEMAIVPNLFVYNQAGTNNSERPWLRFAVDIPAGQRLSARAQCSSTNASDRLMEVIVMAFG